MTSTASYPFLSDGTNIPGCISEQELLGLHLLSSIVSTGSVPHAHSLEPAFDTTVLPLSRGHGLLTAFLFMASPEEIDAPSNFDIDIKKSTLSGHRDAISLRLDYDSVSTSKVRVSSLPTLKAIPAINLSKGSNALGEINIKPYYSRLATSLPLDEDEMVCNLISTVDYPGFYAVSKFQAMYSSMFVSEGTRLTNKLSADYLPSTIREQIFKDAGGSTTERKEPLVTTPLVGGECPDEFTGKILVENREGARVQAKPTEFVSGPTVPEAKKYRMSLSVPIFEYLTDSINTLRTTPSEHAIKIEIASPSHIFRLHPGICISYECTLDPNPDSTTVYAPLVTVPKKALSHLATVNYPILVPDSVRIGGNCVHHNTILRSFVMEPAITQTYETNFQTTKVNNIHEHIQTISPYPVGGTGQISLQGLKFLIQNLFIEIASEESTNPSNEFHNTAWHRGGIPETALVCNPADAFPHGYKFLGTFNKIIKRYFNPIHAFSIEVQGSPLYSNTDTLGSRTLALMTATTPFPVRPEASIIPFVRHGTSNKCCAGINLHQYSKCTLMFQLLSPEYVNMVAIFNKGGTSLRVFSLSINTIVNDGQGSVYRGYYN